MNCFSSSTESPNITTDQSVLLAFKANINDPRNILAANWSQLGKSLVPCSARHRKQYLSGVFTRGINWRKVIKVYKTHKWTRHACFLPGLSHYGL
ncbi:hypothetical protein V6N11_038498 [Hibiscus sabdariffa]|uniref:Uncharacterized protein n=1 Tax=Hibiscus sabdariffa TaxID=183260 RepID=A0ABR2SL40_9ROSI